ncbi:TPR repeat domain-containing protein [Chloropicon primus]|uniref:Uncharacterized protein n=1 Tax=Chloropicon primus TaxID=1764295 RepID=A0A5B8MIC5_9CHLO|nr:hypothetical protein A3770_03p25590 [Chloropicon primus]UPQ99253.1 TPR repeat domain-containing protein [Chloropicon primus]|eukprot:QDZ20041.1 hypothetical protein A3770_03p25590 [Chloropicon primus]
MSSPVVRKESSEVEEKFVSLVLFTDEEEDSSSVGRRSQSHSGEAGPTATSLSGRDREILQLRQEIEETEALAKKYQQSRKGLEASVELLEQVLMSKLQLYGPEAEEVFDTCEQLTLAYNTYAMKLIDREDYDGAHELLKKAEVLTDKDSELSRTRKPVLRLRAVTFNNLGCLYKHRRNFYTAIKYLEKALNIEETTSYAENPASTHLNLCATLSMCGRHDKALSYANAALKILTRQLGLKTHSKLSDFKEAHARDKSNQKLLGTLAIAYHNAATQHEYLSQFEEAIHCYNQAKVVGGLCWLCNSPMATSLRQSHAEFKEKLSRRKVPARVGHPGARVPPSGRRQRPQSAGPRLGRSPQSLSTSFPSSSSSAAALPPASTRSQRLRKKRPASAGRAKRFAKVPIDTVRIYRGEPPWMQKDAKENRCVAPTKTKPEFDTRPSSASLIGRDSDSPSSTRTALREKGVPRYMQGTGGRSNRLRSAVV